MDSAAPLTELGLVLLGLTVGARVSNRLGLSPIPIWLLIGLALGRGGIHPLVTAEAFISVGAQIGVVLLLLMMGLEYSPQELVSGLRTVRRLAVVDLLANATPGLVAGLLLGWDWPVALALGGITYISSSGIAAKLIADQGWLANAETPYVLSLLVAEDLVMAVYLPLLGAVLAGGTAWAVTSSVLVALMVAALALLAAIRFGHVISTALASTSREGLILGVLGITLLVAGVAEHLHVSAAVGAFLVGIAVSGRVRDEVREQLQPLRDVFAAIFFVLFGLQVDPAEIPPVLAVAAALAVVTGLTKAGALQWGLPELSPRARRRAMSTLVSRGEFSIIIAEIAVTAGREVAIGPIATAYVLILALTGPVLARWVAHRPARPATT